MNMIKVHFELLSTRKKNPLLDLIRVW